MPGIRTPPPPLQSRRKSNKRFSSRDPILRQITRDDATQRK